MSAYQKLVGSHDGNQAATNGSGKTPDQFSNWSKLRLLMILATGIVTLTVGWGTAQNQVPSGNDVVQQMIGLKNISAESAKRSLTQEYALEVLVQVDSGNNTVNLIGPAQMVRTAIRALEEMDKPVSPAPYLSTGNTTGNVSQSRGWSDQASQPLPSQPLSSQTFSGFGEENSRNADATGTPAANHLSFRESSNSTAQASPSAQANQPAEGKEPGTYFCKPSHLAMMNRELHSRYGQNSNISFQTLPENNKIIVWAPLRIHNEISSLMTQAGAWANVPAGRDPRELDGTVIRFTTEPRPTDNVRQPMVERTHSPKYATLEQIENKFQVIFGNRFTVLSKPNEDVKKYRIAIPRPGGTTVCELQWDYPNYQINVKATQNLADDVLRLLQFIDQPAPNEGYDRRFISIQNSDPEQIRKLLDVYRSKAVPNTSRRNRANPNALAFQQNGNAATNPVRQVNYQDDGLFGGLGPGFGMGQIPGSDGTDRQGMVVDPTLNTRISVLTDIDVVIIDAPLEEVKRIMELIDQIKLLTADAQSNVEIFYLKHLQSEALDQLLRTELRRSLVQDPGSMMQREQIIFLYMEMFATKQGRVWVIPLINPNAMLIIGWGEAPEAMKAFIEQLDQPVESENSMIRVIPLEFASANEVESALTQFFAFQPMIPGMTQGPAGFYPQVRILSDPKTNTLIVHASPNDYKDVLRIVSELDVGTSNNKLQVKIFRMKNLLALDMATALEGALDMAMNGNQLDQKIPVIELITGNKTLHSGFMTDVSFEPVPANNTVAVTAPSSCMPLIEELIDMLDQSPGVAMVKVIPISYSDAETIQTTLTSVFPTPPPGTTGVSLPGADGGEIFIPVRFGTDTRSNSIIIAGAENDIFFIDLLIKSLDKPDALQRKLTTYRLRNSSAADVSVAITSYLQKRTTLQEDEVISAYQKLQDAVIVEAETISNILIISASEENLKDIEALIKELDEEPPQVVVQVLIVEVTLGKADEFGIELGLQDPYLFNRSTVAMGSAAATGGHYNFNDPAIGLGNNSTDPLSLATKGTLATQLLSNFGTGRVNNDTGFGGMVFSASSDAVSVLIRAMQERSRVEILSRPQITAQDNQLALIFAGQNIYRAEGSTSNAYGGSSSGGGNQDVGIFLGVIPRISRGKSSDKTGSSADGPDRITMLISASKSSLGNEGQPMVFNNTVIRSPNLNKTRVETIVSALDGETVMLGGLLNTDKQEISRRVPFLSSIPIAGNLFKYEYEKQKRTELIIIMRPRIVRNKDDMEAIQRVEFARMNWCLADVNKLHGDIGVYNPMSREPVTGGAPSFTPNAVDMTQLRDMPKPQIHNNNGAPSPATSPLPSFPSMTTDLSLR
ncbi:MAG: hypothetical protein FWD31_05385 [Planctomycetaceae bacterium]|nr:hypothetical protein [Planctomycetaceae bacterium]